MDGRGGVAADVVVTTAADVDVEHDLGTDALVGHRLAGHYRVRARIATRGPIAVYRAVDERHLTDLAVAARPMGADEAAEAGEDAALVETLAHPNLLRVLDHGYEAGCSYLVTELVRGRTLAQVAAHEGPYSPGRALALIEPVLVGLAAAHARGIVHGGVRAQAVLVADDGRIKLADFLGDAGEGPSGDVRAVGQLLFTLTTGRPASRPLPPLSSVLPRVPDYLDALIAGATHVDPRRRPADAGMLLGQVRRVSDALLIGRPSDPALTASLSYEDPADDPADAAPALVVPRGSAVPTARVVPSVHVPAPRTEPTLPPPAPAPAAVAVAAPAVADTPVPAPIGSAPGGSAETTATSGARRGRWWLPALLVLALGTAVIWWLASRGGASSEPIITPAVVGVSVEEASATLEQEGLTPELGEQVFSEVFPAGTVVRTDPVSGTSLREGDRVELVVSAGRDTVFTPTLVWTSLADARVVLERLGLRPGTVTELYDDQKPAGTVIRIEPRAGTSVPVGSTVDLVVSLGPDPAG